MVSRNLTKRVYVEQLKKDLGYNQVCGDEQSLTRWIIAPDVNRPGLELSGYEASNDMKRVSIIGNKEFEYMEQFDYDTQRLRYSKITDVYTPCIIVAANHKTPKALMDLCLEKNFPVFETPLSTYRVVVEVVSYLSEKLAQTDTMHGVMMSIYGIGVMITGKSGIGKSEVALELIRKGHMLVADDAVEIARVHNDIVCQAPDNLKHLLEIRGLGVVDVNYMFGGSSYLKRCDLKFIVKLVKSEEYGEIDRLDPNRESIDIMGLDIPSITIPVSEGKPMSTIIEAAVTTYILRRSGIDANERFKENIYNMIKEKGGNEQ